MDKSTDFWVMVLNPPVELAAAPAVRLCRLCGLYEWRELSSNLLQVEIKYLKLKGTADRERAGSTV